MSTNDGRVKVPWTRTRVRGGVKTVDFRVRGGSVQGNTLTNPGYDTYNPGITTHSSIKTVVDVVTPGFHRLIKQGVRINNPATFVSEASQPYNSTYYRSWAYPSHWGVPNGWEQTEGAVVSKIFGTLYNNLAPSTISEDSLNKLATIGVWNKVEPAKSQSLVTALEAHKSWATIADRAKKLAQAVAYARAGNLKALKAMGWKPHPAPRHYAVWDEDGRPILSKRGKPRKTYGHLPRMTSDRSGLDDAARTWLEFRYGWCPLVYDIIDTLKAVYAADLRNQLLPRDVLQAVHVEEKKMNATVPLDTQFSGLRYMGNRVTEREYYVRTYIHYRWSAPDGVVRRLNDFGLFDVPRAVWEIVPFSFIADWFVPIGDWLGALSPKIGVEILDSGHTIQKIVRARQTFTGPANNVIGEVTYPSCIPVGSNDTYQKIERERKPFLGVPSYPPIEVKMGLKRMVDAAALLKSLR